MIDNTKKRLIIFLLLFIVGTLAGIFGYLNAKITTFEECEKAGWLVRSITMYDGYSPFEKECVLWSGKSFDKEKSQEQISEEQRAIEIATIFLSYPVTVIQVKKLECEGCYSVKLQRDDNQRQFTIVLDNWKIKNEVQSDIVKVLPAPFFPTQKEPATSYMAALLSDKPEELIIKDGCLRAGGYLLVWPYGFSLTTDKDGIFQVIDRTGKHVARVGDKVRIGGGGGEMSGGNSGDITKYSEKLPGRCSGPYWIVGEVLLSWNTSECINPTDSFASEVLLSRTGVSYDLTELKGSKNVTSQEGAVIYRSHYNPDVAVILREINEEYQNGFSVRLQAPTGLVNISYPQNRIEIETQKELLLNRSLIESLGYEIKGRVLEGEIKAELKKGNISVAVWSIKTDGEVHSGVRIIILNSALTPELEKELESIVLSFGTGEEAWNNRKTTAQIVNSINPVPSVNVDINVFDFSEAMKTELIWLGDNKIISGLTDADINEIGKEARRGTAGYNSRIVYFNGNWLPYSRTEKPLLRAGIGCDGLPLNALPVGMASDLASGDSGETKEISQTHGFDKDPLLYDAQVYASNNNVSIEEALRRFQLQNIAGKMGAELSKSETETLAGLWIQHTPEFRIIVLFTRNGEETIKPYLEQYSELADIVEVRTANVSLANLKRDQADASSSVSALGIRVQSDIDVYNNSVELYITKADRRRFDDALQRREIRLPDTVRMITVEAEQMGTDMPLLTPTTQASPEVPGFGVILTVISLLVITMRRGRT